MFVDLIANHNKKGETMANYKQDLNNKTWCVRYRVIEFDKSIETRKRGFKTKRAAELWYSNLLSNKDAENIGARMKLNQLFELYKVDMQERLKASSVKSACDVTRLYILPFFGEKQVNKITAQDIRDWKATINKKDYKYKYKAKMYSAFSALLNFAKKFYGLTFNAVNICGNFTNNEPKVEMSFWTEEEFKAVISNADDLTYKTLFSMLYLTGARKGELLALSWSDIDFNTSIIKIRKSINRKGLGNGISYEVTTPKNKASYRDILMPSGLIKLIKEYKEFCSTIDGFSKTSFVFGNHKPLAEQTIRRKLNKWAELSNVKEIRVHDLRHSHASLLINKGQNILIVSQLLGHSDISRTLNTYGHLFPNAQREIIDAIDIAL